jgi:hypothetical protein
MRTHLLFSASLVAMSFAALQSAGARPFSGSTTYGGHMTTVIGNPGGPHTVTDTDNLTGRATVNVINPQPPGTITYGDNGKLYTPPRSQDPTGSTEYGGEQKAVYTDPATGDMQVFWVDPEGTPHRKFIPKDGSGAPIVTHLLREVVNGDGSITHVWQMSDGSIANVTTKY